ncbi:MAG: S8 family serine peptidase [Chloroflexi bacterium]|nr:S8 family serine peptidase [Chloroflexota bacterium]
MHLNKLSKAVFTLIVLLMLFISPFALVAQAAPPGPGNGKGQEKLSPELRKILASNAKGVVRVIVQMEADQQKPKPGAKQKPEHEAKKALEKHGGAASKALGIVGGASGRINVNRLVALSREKGVHQISYDSQLRPNGSPYSGDMVDFTKALNVDEVWGKGVYGSGVNVAVLDSGVAGLPHGVDPRRIVASVDMITPGASVGDPGGHGTHVAGIIAGKDDDWSGVAPQANIVSVRVIDETGTTRKSTVIQGIQWAIQNRRAYDIRVLNLSLGGPVVGSYKLDPLAGAVEMAWFSGIVVVASAGNNGPGAGTISTPGHDPYIITVGAMDMNATVKRSDDILAWFSARGPTVDGLNKPDVVAPGRKIVSTRVVGSTLDRLFFDRVVANYYLRLCGTSQAAATVSGVTALMLSANRNLRPDQIKQSLKASASKLNGYDVNAVGAGYVDASAAVKGSVDSRRQSARPADGFAIGIYPVIKGRLPLVWKDLNFNGGVDSRGTRWSNATWDNAAWDNATWDNLAWGNAAWDNAAWDNASWDNASWDNASWDNASWDNASWDNASWDNASWDNASWDNAAWDTCPSD